MGCVGEVTEKHNGAISAKKQSNETTHYGRDLAHPQTILAVPQSRTRKMPSRGLHLCDHMAEKLNLRPWEGEGWRLVENGSRSTEPTTSHQITNISNGWRKSKSDHRI